MNDKNPDIKRCCFTGYRPSKFPFKLERDNREYINFENELIETILYLVKKENCHVFYTGMAMGFDIIAAETVLFLRDNFKEEIKLVCIIPFIEQNKSFTPLWQKRYKSILEKSDKTIITSDIYYTGCYQKRNKYMVDNCDYVLTWYDGKTGGTRNTINYARQKLRYIFNANTACKEKFNTEQLTISF